VSNHAVLAPSAAHRWMRCPGSVQLEESVRILDGEPRQNPEAALGTALHELADDALSFGKDLTDFIGMTYNGIEINNEDLVIHRLKPYVDYVNDCERDFGLKLFTEFKVTVHEYCWGTADAVLASDSLVIVVDLKTGSGTMVHADSNKQLLIYALGVYMDLVTLFDFTDETTFRLCISQGAKDHHDEVDVSVKDLKKFKKLLYAAIEATQMPNAPLVPGEAQCQWCLARSSCPALNRLVAQETAQDFADMSAQSLAEALELLPVVKSWIKGVEDRAKERIMNGKPVPGWKAVSGRRSRRWTDEKEAIEYFNKRLKSIKVLYSEPKFMTPAAAEKVLKTAELKKNAEVNMDDVVVWEPGPPTIVPDSDPREPLNTTGQAQSDFAAFKEED